MTMRCLAPVLGGALLLAAATQPGLAQDKVIRIGAPLPLTGGLAPEGLKQKEGYDLWAEEVNKAGGIKAGNDRYKVEFVYYDYQSATPRAVQLTEKLVTEDKVNFIFAPFGSGATKASSNVAKMLRPVPDLVGDATVIAPLYSGLIRSTQPLGMGSPRRSSCSVLTAIAMIVALCPR